MPLYTVVCCVEDTLVFSLQMRNDKVYADHFQKVRSSPGRPAAALFHRTPRPTAMRFSLPGGFCG